MRSGNNFPVRMNRFAHAARCAARGELEPCCVLWTHSRGSMLFAGAVRECGVSEVTIVEADDEKR